MNDINKAHIEEYTITIALFKRVLECYCTPLHVTAICDKINTTLKLRTRMIGREFTPLFKLRPTVKQSVMIDIYMEEVRNKHKRCVAFGGIRLYEGKDEHGIVSLNLPHIKTKK